MTGDGHVPFRGSLGVKLPGATRLRVRYVAGTEFPGRAVRAVSSMTRWCTAARSGRPAHDRAALGERMEQVGLRLHPDKTRVVYCKDEIRRGSAEHVSFDFLGFTFRSRGMRTRQGKVFTGFGPAISKDALNRISAEVRSWRLHQHTD